MRSYYELRLLANNMAYIVNGSTHSPVEFENELELQKIAIQNPDIFQDICNRPIVIGEEIEMKNFGGRGRADILLTDHDGKVILVEVKLSRNTEIIRKIIAQLIDYASAFKGTQVKQIEAGLGWQLDDALLDKPEQEKIRTNFASNMKSGSVECIIITDGINDNLERIRNYLNEYEMNIKLIIVNKFQNELGDVIIANPIYTQINREIQIKAIGDSKEDERREQLNKIRDLFTHKTLNLDLGVTNVQGTSPIYRKITIPKIPKAIHFEFHKWKGKSVHLDIEKEIYFPLAEKIDTSFANDEDIVYHKDWPHGRRISVKSSNASSEEDVEKMIILIQKMMPLITSFFNNQ